MSFFELLVLESLGGIQCRLDELPCVLIGLCATSFPFGSIGTEPDGSLDKFLSYEAYNSHKEFGGKNTPPLYTWLGFFHQFRKGRTLRGTSIDMIWCPFGRCTDFNQTCIQCRWSLEGCVTNLYEAMCLGRLKPALTEVYDWLIRIVIDLNLSWGR